MSEPERVLFVHAHPDDETISTGGTLATLVDRGAGVTVVTCTRGERGEVIPADLQYALESPDTLSALREMELRRAFEALGVTDHRFLGDAGARWASRAPRRYVDSGMRWGANGAEARDEVDPASLSAADFGDVAADIAAVIVEVRPDVVVSYNERGGYGHPDHVRAAQAAQRAAEVYGIPFFAVEPPDSSAPSLSVDVSAVLDRKRAALEAHRSQVVVDGDHFALSNGDRFPIAGEERFRRIRQADQGRVPYSGQPWGVKLVTAIVSAIIGLGIGTLLTVYHQSTVTIAKTAVPIGLVVAVLIVIALVVGLRLAFGTRVIAACAAVGVMVAVGALSLESPGGTVLVPANGVGIAWAIAPTAIAFVVLAWPKIHRRPTGRIAEQNVAKGPQHQ